MAYQTQLLVVMISYMLLLVAWGVYQGRKVKSSSDFAIAGRNLPGWMAALSERATGESSWALLGLPGAAYATGLTEAWTAIGCVAGIVTAWAVISWRLQREAAKYSAETFTDYISKKHGNYGKPIRIISSAVIVFFFFFYVGAQFLGGGKTLNAMFGISPFLGMVITAAIIVPYTIYGGFQSVVHTDVIQAIVMIVTLVIGPVFGIIYISSASDVYASSIPDAIINAGKSYSTFVDFSGGMTAGIVLAGGFSWFFGYLGGQPQLSMRFMAIRDFGQAKKARNIGIVWTIIAYVGALCLGWIGIAIFGPGTLTDPESVMPSVLLKIFPPALAAVLITGAIAAMVSTADSLLILSATEFSENLTFEKNISNGRKKLIRSRLITALLAVVALMAAYVTTALKINLIYTLVSFVWAGIGGTFSVVILFSLFWKKYNGRAVIATILSGITFTILWISTDMEKIITSRILTFFVAMTVAVIFTLLFPGKKPHIDK